MIEVFPGLREPPRFDEERVVLHLRRPAIAWPWPQSEE